MSRLAAFNALHEKEQAWTLEAYGRLTKAHLGELLIDAAGKNDIPKAEFSLKSGANINYNSIPEFDNIVSGALDGAMCDAHLEMVVFLMSQRRIAANQARPFIDGGIQPMSTPLLYAYQLFVLSKKTGSKPAMIERSKQVFEYLLQHPLIRVNVKSLDNFHGSSVISKEAHAELKSLMQAEQSKRAGVRKKPPGARHDALAEPAASQ
jgi:hypothetical protein